MSSRTTPPRATRSLLCGLLAAVAVSACSDVPSAPQLDPSFAKAPSNPDVPVRTNLGTGMSYASDNGSEYVNGVSGVTSRIQSIGDFEMMTGSTRKALITLPAADSGTTPFIGTQALQARFFSSRGNSPDGSARYQDMALGDVARVNLNVSFSYGGKDYGLRMNATGQPGSEWAMSQCVEGGTTKGSCTAWRLLPTNASGSNSAVLVEVARNGATTRRAIVRMSFDITFRK